MQRISPVFILVMAVFGLVMAGQVDADTWDNGANSGLWSGNNNWLDNTEPTITDPVIFPTPIPFGVSSISCISTEFAASLTFNDSYTLGANFLNIGGTGSINVAAGKTATINTVLTGSTGLAKSGTGTLVLTGANTFSGTVSFPNTSGGVLSVRTSANLGNAANTVNLFSGTLRIAPNGSNQTLSFPRAITIGALGATIEVTGVNPTVNLTQPLAGSGPLDIRSNPAALGRLAVFNASSRTATTNIKDAVVRVNNAAGLGSGGVNIGSDPLVGGIGVLEIPDGVNFVNFMFVNDRGAIRSSGALGIVGGTAFITGTGRLIGGLSATDTLRLGNVGSALDGAAGTLAIVEGPGTVLSNTGQNFQGDWRIDSGTLRVGHSQGTGPATTPIVVNNTGTLSLSLVTLPRPITLNNGGRLSFVPPAQAHGPVTIAPGAAVTLDIASPGLASLGNGPNTLTGGVGSSITVAGSAPGGTPTTAATLWLTDPSDYVGNWILASGELFITDPASLGPATNPISLNAGGTLRTSNPVTLPHTVTPNGGTLLVDASPSSAGLTLAAPLGNGSGSLLKSGSGRVTLTAPTAWTGNAGIQHGTLRLETTNALGPSGAPGGIGLGSAVASDTPTLEIANTSFNRQTLTFESAVPTLRGTGTATASALMTVSSGVAAHLEAGPTTADTLTLTGVGGPGSPGGLAGGNGGSTIIVGNPTAPAATPGRVVLTSAGTYIGTWHLTGGTLSISADNQMGGTFNNMFLSGGTLATTGTISSSRIITLSSAPIVGTPGGTIDTATGTTLTLGSAMGGAALLTKSGGGTLVLPEVSNRSGPTTIAEGTIRVSGTTNGLGSGPIAIGNPDGTSTGTTMLELSNADYTSLAASLTLNAGGALRGLGTSAYSKSGFPAVANSNPSAPPSTPLAVSLDVPTGSTLAINSAIRNVVDATPSFATIVKNGGGKLILPTGGTSATDIFSGSWNQQAGILQIGPASPSGETLNALGFKNGDPKQANTIEINGGTLAVGSVNSQVGSPDFLRAGIILRGGAIAGTNGIDPKFGGRLRVHSVFNSKVLLFDPNSPSTPRSVSLVAGAAGPDNLDAPTEWDAGGLLTIDPGTTTGGAFNIARNGGTIAVGGDNATLQINAGATVNLGGTADALSDGVRSVNVANNSNTGLVVTTGVKRVGVVSGIGITNVAPGATLSVRRISQNVLDIPGSLRLRLDTPAVAGSAVSTTNQLILGEGIGVTLGGTNPGTNYTQMQVAVNVHCHGTLDIVRTPGFEPGVGQTFVIMTYDSRIGTFDAVTGLSAGPGRVFNVQYNANDITLVVQDLAGDLNCDSQVDVADIAPFVLAMTDPAAFAQQFPGCDPLHGDVNHDLFVNGLDINLFVNCITGGGCP